MNATAPEARDAAMDETIHHDPCSAETRPRGLGRYTFASGSRPLEGYTLKRAIGRGGFGEVYYATSDAGKEVAIKLITRNLEVERRGVVQCMNLKSPHLIGIHDLRTNDEGDTFVIMEYVAGPSLANILEKHPNGLPLDEVRHWLKGLVEGVAYLHDHGIVHRDLKPANLFLEEGVVKIGDYGLSKAITQSREPGHSESVGTCHYMAPEISTGKYHKPIDIYAMGIIVFELITGRVPFDGESVGEILMKHLTSRPDLSPLPEPYRSIVGRALAKDPNLRPSRVIDLLPPEDAPHTPDVRFIAEGKDDVDRRPVKDEVFQIEAEEPVLYIGPETRPEPPKRGCRARASARAAAKKAQAPPRTNQAYFRTRAAHASPARTCSPTNGSRSPAADPAKRTDASRRTGRFDAPGGASGGSGHDPFRARIRHRGPCPSAGPRSTRASFWHNADRNMGRSGNLQALGNESGLIDLTKTGDARSGRGPRTDIGRVGRLGVPGQSARLAAYPAVKPGDGCGYDTAGGAGGATGESRDLLRTDLCGPEALDTFGQGPQTTVPVLAGGPVDSRGGGRGQFRAGAPGLGPVRRGDHRHPGPGRQSLESRGRCVPAVSPNAWKRTGRVRLLAFPANN